jgi:ABC-type transport system substrate-binding protein
MDLEKKDWAIIILAILAIASIAGNALLVIFPFGPSIPESGVTLVFGTSDGPSDLDPMDTWDAASSDVQDQVCEGLFGYNLSDPDLQIIPKLAADYGIWDGNNYTVTLREDVWFHDGTKFNAISAKWNFDRLANLMENGLAKAAELYEYFVPDYLVNASTMEYGAFFPIINRTIVLDDYTLRFVLNTPYGAFEPILCFNAAYMLSPASTPFDEVIDIATGDLIGTGPFVYDSYEAGVEVKFSAWDFYYKPRAKIDRLIFSVINDAQIRNNALLSGDIDFLDDPMPSMLNTFDSEPDINREIVGTSLSVQYLGMCNYWVNSSFREAISYAFNYSFLIKELMQDQAVRLKSNIPNGITFANDSFNAAVYNITKARLIMQNMGYGIGLALDDDAAWQAQEFVSFNYTYNIGNPIRENIFILLTDNLGRIGIGIEDAGTTFEQFILSLYELAGLYRELNQIFWLGWIPDYNDPSNYVNPLFTNRSVASNGAMYDGYKAANEAGRDALDMNDNVQLLMEAALLNTDPISRELQYDRIQQLLVEEDKPWVFGYTGINNDCYNKDLIGHPGNAMQKVYFYPCSWNIPELYVR